MQHKIAIVGRVKDTGNYERALHELGIEYFTTLTLGELTHADKLLLPGGGDITPAFFGQKNAGSKNIDTELDIIQLQAMEYGIRHELPVLGICKGMQLINVFLGGTVIQHMGAANRHMYLNGDQFHPAFQKDGSILHTLYGNAMIVNSAHHQCIDTPGQDLKVIQTSDDLVPEAFAHSSLPIYGVQWHPERLPETGRILLSFFGALS